MKDGSFCGVMLHLECFLVLWLEFPGDKGWTSALPAFNQGWLSCGAGNFLDILSSCFSSVLQFPSSSIVTGYISVVTAESSLITHEFGESHCLLDCVLLL